MNLSSERKFVKDNIRRHLLKEYLHRETQRAGFGGLDMAMMPGPRTHITLIAERPGMVIGRRGATINRLTEEVQTKYGFPNPQIEVQEADVPALNPHIMVQKLAVALEKGWHFRRAGHSTVMRIMEAGARGCQVEIAGKLTGDRHRRVKFRAGHIKYCGEPKQQWMRISIGRAERKAGTMGLRVMIMDPAAKLPDEIEILPPEELTEVLEEYSPKATAPLEAALEGVEASADELDKLVETELAAEGEAAPAIEAVPAATGPKDQEGAPADAAAAAAAPPAEERKKPKSTKPRAPRKPRKKEAEVAAAVAAPDAQAPAPAAAPDTAPTAPAEGAPAAPAPPAPEAEGGHEKEG